MRGCDLQLQGCLHHLPLIIVTADGVRAIVLHSHLAEGDAVALHLESPGGSASITLAESVLSVLSQGRVRGDTESQGGTATSLHFQIVSFQGVFWRSYIDKKMSITNMKVCMSEDSESRSKSLVLCTTEKA